MLHAASDCLVSCWFYIIWQQHASTQASLQTFQVEPNFSLVLLVQHTSYVGQAHVLTIATVRALLQLSIDPLSLSTTSLLKLKDKEQGTYSSSMGQVSDNSYLSQIVRLESEPGFGDFSDK